MIDEIIEQDIEVIENMNYDEDGEDDVPELLN